MIRRDSNARISIDLLMVLGLALGVTLFTFSLSEPGGDDPYIYARIARNILQGAGWTYNVGSSLDLATSPLYLGLFTLLASFLSDVEVFKLLQALMSVAVGTSTFLLFRRYACGVWLSSLVAILAALFPPLLDWYGLETSLFLALSLAVLLAWEAGRKQLALLLAGLCFCARPEGVLLGFILLFLDYVRSKTPAPLALVSRLFFFPCCALLLHLWYFGTFLSQTSTAKMAQGLSRWWDSALGAVIVWFAKFPFGAVKFAVIAVCLLALLGLIFAWRQKKDALVALAVFAVLHLFAYNWMGVAFYPWYLASQGLMLILLSGFAAANLFAKWREPLPALALLFLLLPLIRRDALYSLPLSQSRTGYEEIAKQISPFLSDGQTLLTVEIGVIGWALPNLMVVDTVGLTQWLPLDRVAAADFAAWLDERTLPDAVLVLKRFAPLIEANTPARQKQFAQHYQLQLQGQASVPGFEFELFSRKLEL